MFSSTLAILIAVVLIAAWLLFRKPETSSAPEYMVPRVPSLLRPYRTVGQCVRATGNSWQDCGRIVLGNAYSSLNECVDDGHRYAACSYLPLTTNA
jgi:hypothetical protein